LVQAAESLKAEQRSEGLRLAEQALSTFRQCGDTRGLADAGRLVAHAMIQQERRKEADRLLKDELAVFQTSQVYTSRSAEARLLLGLAEVSSDRRGQKKREEALRFVGQARTMAIDEADVGLQASTLATMARIFVKYKGDRKACGKEAYRLASQALQLYQQTKDVRGQAIAEHWCAFACGHLGELAEAIQHLGEAVSFWRQSQDAIMEAAELIFMGEWLLHGGQPQQAVVAVERALACFHACGVEDQRELRAVHLVVNAQIARGEPWRAIWTAEDAVARYRHRKERRMEAQALLCVAKGYSHSPSGREQQEVPQDLQMKMKPPPEEAVAAMQQALQIARQLNDSVLEAQVMTALSSTHVKREEMEEAIFAAHDALSHREVKDTVGKGVAFQSLASAHLHNKDYDTAERAARAARDICRKEDLWQGDASGLLSMAEVLLAEDKLEESVETAKEAQGLYAEHKDRKGEAQSLLQVAKARLAGMHYEKALHAAERAHELFLRVNDQLGKCSALGVMAECRSQLLQRQQQQSTAKFSRGKRATGVKAPLPWEELSRAAKVSKEATEAAKRVGDLQAEASARCIMAQIHIFNGRPQSEILEALEEAMALAVEGGEPKIEGTALLLKAEVHLQAEELKDALNAARQAQLLLKDADTASKAKVEEILDRLRVHEFRVDEAPSARATYGGFDPRLAAMMPAMVSGPDPATVRATIQEVTRKMVGKEDDVEADMPLMDIGINSMNAVLFRNKLTSEFADIQLPTTLVFDYPTVKALSSLVVEQTSAAAAAANQAAMAAMPAFPTALGAMGGAMAPVRADPAIITSKIQEVTKGMVGSSGDIDADMPLMDIGINSMNAVLFRNKLGSTFEGVELPSTLVFDFPTIRAMTDLLSQLTEQ